jgi:hypothetical protein
VNLRGKEVYTMNTLKRMGRWIASQAVAVLVAVTTLGSLVLSARAEGEPELTFPVIVSWSQVVTAVVAFIAVGFLAIVGVTLGFRVVRKLLNKLGGAAG